MEDNEKDLIRTGTHDDDDELAFLHDSPSVKQKQQKVPKVFPIAGAVADSKYK